MFICCPKCEARYQISDDIRLSADQKFKCSACGMIFVEEMKSSDLERQPVLKDPVVQDTQLQSAGDDVRDDLDNLGNVTLQNDVIFQNERDAILPEAFVPVEDKKRFDFKRGALWAFVFIFVFVAGILLYCKPVTKMLEDAVNRFTKDMMPNMLAGKKELSQVRVNIQPKHKNNDRKNKKSAALKNVKKGVTSSEKKVEPETQKPTEALIQKQDQKPAEVLIQKSVEQKPTETLIQKQDQKNTDSSKPVNELSAAVSADEVADQIKIRGVSFRIQETPDQKSVLIVEGMMFNLSDKQVALPALIVRAENEAGEVIQTGKIVLSESETAPNHAQSFSGIFPAVPNVHKVSVVLK